MMKIFAIAAKDLRSTLRNRAALVMMLVAPLALAALLGFAFGGGSGGFDIAATKVVVANLDAGGAEAGQNAGAAIQKVLTSKDLSDVLETSTAPSAAAARKAVDDGKAAVAVIVPEGFSAVVFGSDPSARSQLELYENPTAEIGGSIVEGVVDRVLADFNGARAAAAGAVALRSDAAGDPPAAQVAATAAEAFSHSGGVAAGLRIDGALAPGRQVGPGRQRHRPHPRRHDGLLHVLRRRQRGAHDPHRGPRRYHATPVHHADAARHDHRRQVRLHVPDRPHAGDRAAHRGPSDLRHPLGSVWTP